MTIRPEEVLIDMLTDRPIITDVVGLRIYPIPAEEETLLPYITYTLISNIPDHHMRGTLGMKKASFQIGCWGSTYTEALELADAVVEPYSLNNDTGGIDGLKKTINDFEIQCCFVVDESDILDYDPGSDKSKKFNKRIDIEFWYNIYNESSMSSASSSSSSYYSSESSQGV